MKSEHIYDGISGIRENLVEEAEGQNLRETRFFLTRRWRAAVSFLLVVVILGGLFLLPKRNGSLASAYALSEAEYPEMTKYPKQEDYIDKNGELDYEAYDKDYIAWWEEQRARRGDKSYAEGMEPYFTEIITDVLSGESKENKVFSPINIYMALGILAETAEGESREQILHFLGKDSIEELRADFPDLWNASYQKDGAVNSVPAASLWLSDSAEYKKELLDILSENYYASSYRGEMGSSEYDKAFTEWLNEQTGGLLKDQCREEKLTEETLMTIAATVYFQAKWSNEFYPQYTKEGIFHGAEDDVTADFMHKSYMDRFFVGETFRAAAEPLENGGKMWFILPGEGVRVDEILNEEDLISMILNPDGWKQQKWVLINTSLPKFDIQGGMDLKEYMVSKGITAVFDPEEADFSPLTENNEGIYLSKINHEARTTIDEEGVSAAAYTLMELCGSAMPEEEVDFTLDRPFLFVITTRDDLPLFAGVVNQL